MNDKKPAGGAQLLLWFTIRVGILCGAPIAVLLSYSRVQPQLLEQLHAEVIVGGLLQATAMMSIAFPGIWLMGIVRQHVGPHAMVRYSVIVLGAAVAVMPHISDLRLAFLMALLIGTLGARVDAAVRQLMSDSIPDGPHKNQATKDQATLITGGFAVGVFGLLGVLTLLTGFVGLNIAMAVLGAVLVFLAIVVPPELPPVKDDEADEATKDRKSLRSVWHDRIALVAIVQYGLQGVAYGFWIGPLAELLHGHGHGPKVVAAFGFDGLVTLGALVLVQRLGKRVSGLLAIAGFLVGQLICTTTLWSALPLVAVLLAGMIMEDVTTNWLVSDCMFRMRTETAKSVGNAARQAGVSAGVALGGVLLVHFGDKGIFFSGVGLTALVCVPLAVYMHRHQPVIDEQPES